MSVSEQLVKILASRDFRESPRMCRFLQFVVETALAGQGGTLKEYLIGVEVFDRESTYDPRIDPIVRVEARRLRSKLASYYEREGRSDPIVIELPTGTYAPVFRGGEEKTGAAEPVSQVAVAGAAQQQYARTLAVLPFANLTTDPEGEYFTDGLTEELTHVLTKVPGLQVVSWNSTIQLKGHPPDAVTVAERLQADVFVRGSVRTAPRRMRITAQLLEAPRGVVLWSESYDREPEDIFALQQEIATAIAQAMQMRLIDYQRPGPEMAVYNLYLKGRYYWNTRTPDGLRRSVECFKQAIALDQRYALAYAGLADAWTILVDYGVVGTEQLRDAEDAARQSIEIDNRLPEPYATLALIRQINWDWQHAEELYHRSIALNPSYSTAHHWLGIDLLGPLGRFEEAMERLEIAQRLDPLSVIVPEGRAMLLMWWGRYEESLALYEDLLRRNPGAGKLLAGAGRVHAFAGSYGRAIELLELAAKTNSDVPSRLGALGQVYGWAGRVEDARRCLQQLHVMAEERPVPGTCFAVIQEGVGEPGKALEWLEVAADRHDPPILSIGVHPAYDSLRSELRFQALLQRVGLTRAAEQAFSYRKAAQ